MNKEVKEVKIVDAGVILGVIPSESTIFLEPFQKNRNVTGTTGGGMSSNVMTTMISSRIFSKLIFRGDYNNEKKK